MPHLDELTLMMYLDQELSLEETGQVKTHLANCPQCHELCSRMKADQQLFFATFTESFRPSESPIELNPFTQAQVEAIASLHKRNHQHSVWRPLSWLFILLAAAGSYWLFLQSYLYNWLSQTWETWQYNLMWSSAFWIKEYANDLLLAPQTGAIQVSLLFMLLLGALVLLRSRYTSLLQERHQDGGHK
jgi:hypothetical protein